MPLITRVNEVTNPCYETDLVGWSAIGTASISRVASFLQFSMRITWGAGASGSQGAKTTMTGRTIGSDYRCWAFLPVHTGTTTTQFGIVGIGNGAAIATTNNTLFTPRTFHFTDN